MNDPSLVTAWSDLAPEKFEELISWILQREGFFNLSWRRDAGPKGRRDIACHRTELLEPRISTGNCLVRCDSRSQKLDHGEILRLAESTSGSNYFILVTSATVGTTEKDAVASATSGSARRVAIWERADLLKLLNKHQDLRFQFLDTPLSADFFLQQLTGDQDDHIDIRDYPPTHVVKAALEEACAIALEDNQPITLAHIFLALLKEDTEVTCKLISDMGGSLTILNENLISIIMEQPQIAAYEYGLIVSSSVRGAMGEAAKLADLFSYKKLDTRTLLLAISSVRGSQTIESILHGMNITLRDFATSLLTARFNPNEIALYEDRRRGTVDDSDSRMEDTRAFRTFHTTKLNIGDVLRQDSGK